MGYNITIDRGNTAIKAVLWEGSRMVDELVVRHEKDAHKRLAEYINARHITGAIGCSVDKSYKNWLRPLGLEHCPTVIELDHNTPVPLKNGYATPATLGADRLAAAVGAATLLPGQQVLVCDLGTACTYDIVSADGHFAGGNIAPGVGMRLRALHHYTCRLPEVNSHGPVMDFGTDTLMAMRSGALHGVAAEVLYYRTLGTDVPRATILTGGWSAEIMNLMPPQSGVILNPHLVNLGLNSILLYNEN